jgi:lysine 2,3-aminomutase
MRVDAALAEILAQYRPLWLVTHFNHPREVTDRARQALNRLAQAGLLLNNQSVLLKGVNDATATLIELSQKLLTAGVRPYYLHQVDAVPGADRFRVPLDQGRQIVKSMFGRISGLGIPRYVLDLPGGKGKVPLTPSFETDPDPGYRIFESPLDGKVRLRKKSGNDWAS